jgi:hypothetical protein
MPQHVIIHSVSIINDGIGDLVYFLNWLKLYKKHYKNSQDRIVISVLVTKAIFRLLFEIQEQDPQHPIFEFVTATYNVEQNSYGAQAKDSQKCFINKIYSSPKPHDNDVNVFEHFFDIGETDYITIIYLSIRYNYALTPGHKNKFCNIVNILEFDGVFFEKLKLDCYLGLGSNNLGMLTDVDGITGQEDIDTFINGLSKAIKESIFQVKDIDLQQAAAYLLDTPSVFGYLHPLTNFYFLHAILMSPFIQEAIKSGKVPLFFFTNVFQTNMFPSSVKKAIENKQIRMVTMEWLNRKEYYAVNGLFLNKNTKSIIVPSGDNSLSMSIKAGKLPFYAHKLKCCDIEPYFIKCGIFSDMVDLMELAMAQGDMLQDNGYNSCIALMKFLSKRYESIIQSEAISVKQYYLQAGKYVTQEAIDYFHDHVAPYIMLNYSFENKSLQKILLELEKHDTAAQQYDPELDNECGASSCCKFITRAWNSFSNSTNVNEGSQPLIRDTSNSTQARSLMS